MDAALEDSRRSAGSPQQIGVEFPTDPTLTLFALPVPVGGSTMASVLLGLPPSWLTTPHLLPLYSAIYILICLLPISFLLALLPTPVLPLLFSTLDAVNRSLSIASTLALLASHPDPFLRSSPSSLSSLLPTLLLPALAVSGGGLVTSFLSLSSDRWALAPPPFLRPGNSLRTTLLSSLDLWSGAVAAAMYDFLVDGPGTKALRVQSAGAVTAFGTRSGSLLKDEEKFHPGAWSALEARAACVLLLAVLLGGRAIALWLGEEQQPAATIANGKVLEKERGIEPMDEKTRQGGSSTGSSVSATASSPAARLRRTKEFQ